jgi:glucosamine-6-phosphate deaminase
MSISITISKTPEENGALAAALIAQKINTAIKQNGEARIVLSTGASQFEMFVELIRQKVDWTKVVMFHLDEYVGLPETHKASFRKYLKERFSTKVQLKKAFFVNGEGNIEDNITALSNELRRRPIDVGVIGIGENGHIAFNDPPADFDSDMAYKVVNLDTKCRMQQVHEGWFAELESVPRQAISMLPKQIMSCGCIVSIVPHLVKAQAVYDTITSPVSPMIPATLMKTHPDWHLFADHDAASKLCSFK